MLHGWAQNAKIFMHRTMKVARKMKNAGYDVIYVDAPHVLPTKSVVSVEGQPVEITNTGRANARAWFTYNAEDPCDVTEAQSGNAVEYIGLDGSLQFVAEILSEYSDQKQTVIVFGFSQGAAFAHVLASLATSTCKESHLHKEHGICKVKNNDEAGGNDPFRCIKGTICVGGFPAMHRSQCLPTSTSQQSQSRYKISELTDSLSIPSLHMIGRNDTSVSPALSMDLAELFLNHEMFEHDKGHCIPTNSASCTKMISFLDSCSEISFKDLNPGCHGVNGQ